MEQFYLEYRVINPKLGLMGDVTSLFGLLDINIKIVSTIPPNKRAFLLEVPSADHLTPLKSTLGITDNLEILELHPPTYIDMLTLRHGRKILQEGTPPTYNFHRGELAILVDFLAQTLREKKNPVIGIQGAPRVGKTEVAIASCVHANRRWVLLSSTFLRQIAREKLDPKTLSDDSVIIIDALTSFFRSSVRHRELLMEIIRGPNAKIIEHPLVFLKELNQSPSFFNVLTYLKGENQGKSKEQEVDPNPFSSFDIS